MAALESKLEAADLPSEASKVAMRDLARLKRMQASQPEYTVRLLPLVCLNSPLPVSSLFLLSFLFVCFVAFCCVYSCFCPSRIVPIIFFPTLSSLYYVTWYFCSGLRLPQTFWAGAWAASAG